MKIIQTKKAPEAIGPYSQGVKTDRYIFTSGQIGINPSTGQIVRDDLEAEILQVLKNLNNILIEGGSSIDRIVKLNVYLLDLENFDILNKIFQKMFLRDSLPARSTVQVSRLPKDVNIEIDAIAQI